MNHDPIKPIGNQKHLIFISSFILACLIIFIDDFSRIGEHLTVLLLIPVYFATWYSGFRSGLFMAIFSASSLILDPLIGRKIYPHLMDVFWNMLVMNIFFIIIVNLLARLKNELTKAVKMALTDNLTGLLNSRAFFDLAEKERLRSIRYGKPFSLCFLDLDNFKIVNDTLGHTTGDELLKIVGSILKSHVRETDVVARLGGDEFAILLPETGPDAAKPLIDKLHTALNRGIDQRSWPVTPSLGVATFFQVPGTVNDILHQTDLLMYAAKKAGKNCIQTKTFGNPPKKSENQKVKN